MKLNLGCNDDLKAGWLNVDIAVPAGVTMAQKWVEGGRIPRGSLGQGGKGQAFQLVDLNYEWPWDDDSAEVVYAHEVFEHVHGNQLGQAGKIHVMNEAWRVLKPGGFLDMTVPACMDRGGIGNAGAFADPTHATFWTWNDQFYYSEQFNHAAGERGRLGPGYGIKARFRFPLIYEDVQQIWSPVRPQRDNLLWEVRQPAPGAFKLLGILEAVK